MGYYIKGNKERGTEVIKLLESKGGINISKFSGTHDKGYYWFGKNKIIDLTGTEHIVKELCEELILPEEVKNVEKKKKYRPYVYAEEFLEAESIHGPWFRECGNGNYCRAINVYAGSIEYNAYYSGNSRKIQCVSFNDLYKKNDFYHYKWKDGTRMGIEIDD